MDAPQKKTTSYTYDDLNRLLNASVQVPFNNVGQTVNSTVNVSALVVGGGGGGGANYATNGGAGGGGQVIFNPAFPVAVGSYEVTQGRGGSYKIYTKGDDSSFGSIVAKGGWGGGDGSQSQNGTGGQGGTNGDGIHIGGNSIVMPAGTGAGGGGGAGGNGMNGSGQVGGNGGVGIANSITGSEVFYGTGGGNGSQNLGQRDGHGGNVGGAAARGAVIISYPTGTLTATGGVITTVGANTVHTFLSEQGEVFTVTALLTPIVTYSVTNSAYTYNALGNILTWCYDCFFRVFVQRRGLHKPARGYKYRELGGDFHCANNRADLRQQRKPARRRSPHLCVGLSQQGWVGADGCVYW